jgi:hypothetical protein
LASILCVSCSHLSTSNTASTYYTEAQAAADAQLLAAKKIPKNYILLDSDDQADAYLIEGTLENLPAGAKVAWFVDVHKQSSENNAPAVKGDIVHTRLLFTCQGHLSWPDIVVYDQQGKIKKVETHSPYEFHFILPFTPGWVKEKAVCPEKS